MSEIKRNGILAAAVFVVAFPSSGIAESLLEPSDFGDEGDGAEFYVQLEEDFSDDGSEGYSGDEGSDEYSDEESSTDGGDENTDVAQDNDLGADSENDVAEVEDAWTTATGDESVSFGGGEGGGGGGDAGDGGGGIGDSADEEGPIYVEFSSGSGPVQRNDVPVDQEELDVALQSGVVPTAPVEADSAPTLAASEKFDPTMGINVHDKVAVGNQCAVLLDSGQVYQAFYKLYCD